MNTFKNFLNNEDGITAIEYAIIGVAMSSALFFIFSSEGTGFLESLEDAWEKMSSNISRSGNVLGS
ncbi:hypothetical protein BS333_00920 [Vibrio azureus]|uniref:Flp family type IVb pilin n=1 Tax=Vibrio azureus NBRC 104587 TaxID=1219077 RepID=U3C2K9_9VIBR|nr:Flp family type IVb pilin [Vibrio azureus]AUI85057.1 hypothetical protein BS333_00920 [Vibrio azureus]GAD75694.1 hypothetical protein VAZ01S_028_00480 [Vibrio azureus NBRC 104587]